MRNRNFSRLMLLATMTLSAILPLRALAAMFADLQIKQVAEYDTTARVYVSNQGTVFAAACRLYAYRQTPGGWVFINQTGVPALAPGAGTWVSVSGAGINLPNTLYFVDATNLVPEGPGELNNRVVIP